MKIIWKPVRNYTKGRAGYKPIAIVIHIADGSTMNGTHSWFNNPKSLASAHYGIRKNGEVWQFVKDEDTAWHAGGVANPNWKLLKPGTSPNYYTIGIEHEGFTGEKFTSQMIDASSHLLYELSQKWRIPLDRDHIIGHNQINSRSRSRCPGAGVDLNKLISLAKSYNTKPMENLQKEITRLQSKINELSTQNNSLTKTVVALEAEKSRLASQNKELIQMQSKFNEIAAQYERLNKLVKALEIEKTSLVAQNNEFRVQTAKQQQLVDKLTKDIDTLKKGGANSLESATISELLNAIKSKVIK